MFQDYLFDILANTLWYYFVETKHVALRQYVKINTLFSSKASSLNIHSHEGPWIYAVSIFSLSNFVIAKKQIGVLILNKANVLNSIITQP